MTNHRAAQIPRRRRLALIGAPLAIGVLVAGCAAAPSAFTDAFGQEEAATSAVVASDAGLSAEEVLAENQDAHDSPDDAGWDPASATEIALDDADGAVTIDEPGTYVLAGSLSGGVVVDSEADGTVTLVLDGADIDNTDGAAIDIRAAEEAVVILADGSQNSLSDSASYAADADANAALYSSADLTITGTGVLSVRGNGNDGIASSDGLVIQSGDLTVEAVDDGLRGKDYLIVRDGQISVTAGGDGLKADNEEEAERGYILLEEGNVTVEAGDDGLAAATDVVTTGGALDVVAGGGSSGSPGDGSKGISAGVIAVLEGGTLRVDSADDGLNTGSAIHFAGADVTLATADDGAKADIALVISSGSVTVTEAFEGIEAGGIEISGGVVDVTASDDGINVSAPDDGESAMELLVSGGDIVIDASSDGIDVNEGMYVNTGGVVTVYGPTDRMQGALDADSGIEVSGGTLMAAGFGGLDMAPLPESPQASVYFSLPQVAAGTELVVTDSVGAELGALTAMKETAGLVFSAAEIADGEEYTLTADGAAIATAIAGEQTNTTGQPDRAGGGGPGGPGGQDHVGGSAPPAGGGGEPPVGEPGEPPAGGGPRP